MNGDIVTRAPRTPDVHAVGLGPWAERAACVGKPPEWFDLIERDELVTATDVEDALDRQVEAANTCDGCPVRIECLTHAFEHHELGVWGGYLFRADPRSRPLDLIALLYRGISWWNERERKWKQNRGVDNIEGVA